MRPGPLGGSAAGLLSERDAIARVLPSVVHIATNSSVGTGYVVRDNLIATNAHVVSTNPTAEIRTQDGKTLIGQVVARDAKQDIALIKVSASRLPVVTLANSKSLRPGAAATAVAFACMAVAVAVAFGVISAMKLAASE